MAEPASGIEAMQSLNRTVFRSFFLASFVALVPISVGLGIYGGLYGSPQLRWLLIFAAVIYVVGVFGVTGAGNVPLNEKLDGMISTEASTATFWIEYGRVWTRWNHVRTACSMMSALLYLLASVTLAFEHGRIGP